MHRHSEKPIDKLSQTKTPTEVKIQELADERVAVRKVLKNGGTPTRPMEKIEEALVEALETRINELIAERNHAKKALSHGKTPTRPLAIIDEAISHRFFSLIKLDKDNCMIKRATESLKKTKGK